MECPTDVGRQRHAMDVVSNVSGRSESVLTNRWNSSVRCDRKDGVLLRRHKIEAPRPLLCIIVTIGSGNKDDGVVLPGVNVASRCRAPGPVKLL